jgi:adenine phosphoribosyltransferase
VTAVGSWLAKHVRDVPDFPRPGVVFKDLTPLLKDPAAFERAIGDLAERFSDRRVARVVGIEARGFIAAAPVALRLGAGFVPMRKAGRLPWRVAGEAYELEYGTDRLEVHEDALEPGEQVLVIDDVLATGGTAEAACRLVERLGAEVVGLGFLVELAALGGRRRLAGRDVVSLLCLPGAG